MSTITKLVQDSLNKEFVARLLRAREIRTHGGNGHFDEFAAAAVVNGLLVYGFDQPPLPILRVSEVALSQLADPEIIVIDVGRTYAADVMDFDHHQFPADSEPTCSLTLLLRAAGVEDRFRMKLWLEAKEWIDSRGPAKTSEKLGIHPNTFFQLFSPVEHWLVDAFGATSCVEGGWLQNAMIDFGWSLFQSSFEFEIRFAELTEQAGILYFENLNEVDQVVPKLPDGQPNVKLGTVMLVNYPQSNPGLAVDAVAAARERTGAVKVCGSITRESKDTGGRDDSWVLHRRDDHQKIDFRRISGEPGVMFVHANGFIAKVRADLTEAEVGELFRKSIG